MARRGGNRGNRELNRMVNRIDMIHQFAEIFEDLLPELKKDVLRRASPEELRAKYQALLTARQISIALTEEDGGKANSAIKDLLDREQGKPTERRDVTHRMAKAKESDLDAAIQSKLVSAGIIDLKEPNES